MNTTKCLKCKRKFRVDNTTTLTNFVCKKCFVPHEFEKEMKAKSKYMDPFFYD